MFHPTLKLLQKFLAATIAEERGRMYGETTPPDAPILVKMSPLADELGTAALVWLQEDPPTAYHEMAFKVSPIARASRTVPRSVLRHPVEASVLTTGQNEGSVDLQTRSAVAVGSFVKFCVNHNLMQPPDKIVKNLCTSLCQDAEQTPTFSYTTTILNGIISFQGSETAVTLAESAKNDKTSAAETRDTTKSRITRRVSALAFVELSS
jgi:hypothetical protein